MMRCRPGNLSGGKICFLSSTILKKTGWMATYLAKKGIMWVKKGCFLNKHGSDRINEQVGLLV